MYKNNLQSWAMGSIFSKSVVWKKRKEEWELIANFIKANTDIIESINVKLLTSIVISLFM